MNGIQNSNGTSLYNRSRSNLISSSYVCYIFLYNHNLRCSNESFMYEYNYTIIIALAGGLSTIFVLLIAVVITAICISIRSKKKPQSEESDVYYDTINVGHQPPILETKLNIAYCQPKKLK